MQFNFWSFILDNFEAAGSIGGMMITTECMVSELPAKETAPAGGMPPGGMPDMGGMM